MRQQTVRVTIALIVMFATALVGAAFASFIPAEWSAVYAAFLGATELLLLAVIAAGIL